MVLWHAQSMPRKRDENETAFDTLQGVLGRDAARDGMPQPPKPKPEKLSYRVEAGHKGGKLGGEARAKSLSALRRSAWIGKAGGYRSGRLWGLRTIIPEPPRLDLCPRASQEISDA
jgi:hypothetical protein